MKIPLFAPFQPGAYNRKRVLQDVLKSLGVLAACTFTGFLFYLLGYSEANIITIYILGILLISSITIGPIYGLASSLVGVVLFNCLFAIPRFTLFFFDWQYSITTIIMFAASLVTSSVMAIFRHQLEKETLQTRRTEVLLETSQSLQKVAGEDEIFTVALTHLQHLHASPAFLLPVRGGVLARMPIVIPGENAPPPPTDEDFARLEAWLSTPTPQNQPLILEHGGWQTCCFRVRSSKMLFAVAALVTHTNGPMDGFEWNLTLAMLDEVSLALSKHHMQAAVERAEFAAQAEQLRANLLRAISHDLRTPLTSISGNADMLLVGTGILDDAVRKQMYQSISDDSKWLTGVVENLLFVTRFEGGHPDIHCVPELPGEIIPEALKHVDPHTSRHAITAELPDELFFVVVDAQLIVQVLVNLVGNAIKYTPTGTSITVRVFREGNTAHMEVADTGPGISDEDKPRVFDMFFTGAKPGGERREFGLGLALCKSIVHAHGGGIYVRDNTPHGAIVGFTLPIKEVDLDAAGHSGG